MYICYIYIYVTYIYIYIYIDMLYTTPPPHHRGEGDVPHPHHTTGGEGVKSGSSVYKGAQYSCYCTRRYGLKLKHRHKFKSNE